MANSRALVTGGSGFLGTQLCINLLEHNWDVTVLDLHTPSNQDVHFIRGDIRNQEVCDHAVSGIDVVFHNVAQVPLAKNESLFKSVNIDGSRRILDASLNAEVKNFVMTSSSAVYGLPVKLPANLNQDLIPVEAYGKAKLEGENQITDEHRSKIDISIVRPRTILGPGRLGLFSILFDWISNGIDVFIFGDGQNPYQFIHSADLVEGLRLAGDLEGSHILNLGALSYRSLRDDLEELCVFAKTGSKVRSIPEVLVKKPLLLGSKVGLLPFASYQILLYSQAMYFESSADWEKLHYQPKYSNIDSLKDSYLWYLEKKESFGENSELSVHQQPSTSYSLRLLKSILKIV